MLVTAWGGWGFPPALSGGKLGAWRGWVVLLQPAAFGASHRGETEARGQDRALIVE